MSADKFRAEMFFGMFEMVTRFATDLVGAHLSSFSNLDSLYELARSIDGRHFLIYIPELLSFLFVLAALFVLCTVPTYVRGMQQ